METYIEQARRNAKLRKIERWIEANLDRYEVAEKAKSKAMEWIKSGDADLIKALDHAFAERWSKYEQTEDAKMGWLCTIALCNDGEGLK